MNKWQIICPVTLMAIVAIVGFHGHVVEGRRIITSAVIGTLDAHSSNIAVLLGTMRTNTTTEVEDAVYESLQRKPYSTSLIERSDIQVTRTTNGLLQCLIDTSRFDVPSRTISQATSTP